MTVYQKINGVWTAASRPYVKRNGVWTAVSSAWVRRSGTWTQAYIYDVTPPNPPEISLEIIEDFGTVNGSKTLLTRYIKVGTRLPGSASDPDLKMIRMLTDYNGAAPTTQFGGTYTTASDGDWPDEPWSEWRYNTDAVWWSDFLFGSAQKHSDTSVYYYKQWPRNASAGTILKGDTTYHFGGWSLDHNGNWSVSTQASIHVPKDSVSAPNVVIKEARIQPNNSGSWKLSSGYVSGDLVQQKSPRSEGVWFYGNQFSNSIANTGVTIRNAQIAVYRENDDGAANANIYLFWTPYGSPAALPSVGTPLTHNNTTLLGTLAKGQSKWFDLPTAFNADLRANIKGMGLHWKDPAKADAFPEDYSVVTSVATNLRCGEVHVVWDEQL